MSGAVTGFQRPYTFQASPQYPTVGMDTAVMYVEGSARAVTVPITDNQPCAGVVTYQYEDRDQATVAVQLDRIGILKAVETINFGDDIVIGAGGVAKSVNTFRGATPNTVKVNVLGEAQNTVQAGDMVQILIRPKVYTI